MAFLESHLNIVTSSTLLLCLIATYLIFPWCLWQLVSSYLLVCVFCLISISPTRKQTQRRDKPPPALFTGVPSGHLEHIVWHMISFPYRMLNEVINTGWSRKVSHEEREHENIETSVVEQVEERSYYPGETISKSWLLPHSNKLAILIKKKIKNYKNTCPLTQQLDV